MRRSAVMSHVPIACNNVKMSVSFTSGVPGGTPTYFSNVRWRRRARIRQPRPQAVTRFGLQNHTHHGDSGGAKDLAPHQQLPRCIFRLVRFLLGVHRAGEGVELGDGRFKLGLKGCQGRIHLTLCCARLFSDAYSRLRHGRARGRRHRGRAGKDRKGGRVHVLTGGAL